MIRLTEQKLLIKASWRWLVIALAAISLCACRAPLGLRGPSATPAATASLSDQSSSPSQADPGMITRGQNPVSEQVPSQPFYQAPQTLGPQVAGPTIPHASPQQQGQAVPLPSPAPQVHFATPDIYAGAPGCEACVAGPGHFGNSTQSTLNNFPPYNPDASWRPVGIRGPWPRDEYLCDGGDQASPTRVGPDFAIYGLDIEDTVVHYDTVDGRREVEASNKVCVYAPRFSSVRQVKGIFQHDFALPAGRIDDPVSLGLHEDTLVATPIHQNIHPAGQIGRKQTTAFRDRIAGIGIENAQGIQGYTDILLPYEKFELVASGTFDQTEKARLSQAIENAVVWTHEKSVQVVIGDQRLAIDTHDTKLGEVLVFEHEGEPKMRIVKIASHKDARPGEIVEFTLRFDNVGSEIVGNVTIVDNLTTRLEYVEGSATCTVEANFFKEENEADSLGLRWEVIEPMEAGQGGVIRFKCRVR